MTELLKELVEMLKDMAPEVWATLLRQAQIEAIEKLLWGLFLLALTYLFIFVSKKCYEKHKEKDGDRWYTGEWLSGVILLLIIATVLCVVAFSEFVGAFKWFANPEFIAIQYLIRSLR